MALWGRVMVLVVLAGLAGAAGAQEVVPAPSVAPDLPETAPCPSWPADVAEQAREEGGTFKLEDLAWRKGKVSIVPFGYGIFNVNYNTSSLFIGSYVLYANPANAFNRTQLEMSAQNTILGVDFTGPSVGDAQTSGRIDFDFRGPNPVANNASPYFFEEDIHFVRPDELLRQISNGLAQLTLLQKQFEERSISSRPFRVVLAGRPNAGKSSLFNALSGSSALVSSLPGTTRDYLTRRIELNGLAVELVDTAGWCEATDGLEEQAQALRREQSDEADLLLLCAEAGKEPDEQEQALRRGPATVTVATKCDLAAPPEGWIATSAVTGAGLDELRELVTERACQRLQPALAPSLSRCRHHVEACVRHLRRSHEMVLFEEPAELLALELRGALDELGAMVGAIYTDDLLDRIFSRFCIGK